MSIDILPETLPPLYTLDEVSVYFHNKPDTIRKLCKRIGLDPVRSRPTLLFTASDIQELVEASRQCSNASSSLPRPARRSGASVAAPTRTTESVSTRLR